MATEEDLKKAEDEAAEEGAEDEATSRSGEEEREVPADEGAAETKALAKASADDEEESEARSSEDEAPVQLGYQRYVYAAYMAGAMIAAFLTAKIGHVAWYRLGQWKPELGEPKDELIYPVAALIGIVVALYYWRKPSARQYANEVAEELSKVTWPSRKEVTNSTTVVVLTTVFATVFFALMDRFWSFVTDKIYTF